MVAAVGDTVKGIINVNHKVTIEALMEVYFKVIARRNTIFVRNQIAS